MLTLTAKNNSDWSIFLNGDLICSKDTKDAIYKVEIDNHKEFARVHQTYKVDSIDNEFKQVFLKTY
jgi:hypothetical protein